MESNIDYLLRNLTGIIALVTGILAIYKFLLGISTSDINKITKSNLEGDSEYKVIVVISFVTIIILSAILLINSKNVAKNIAIIFLITTMIDLGIFIIVHIFVSPKLRKLKTKIFSINTSIDDLVFKNQNTCIIISYITMLLYVGALTVIFLEVLENNDIVSDVVTGIIFLFLYGMLLLILSEVFSLSICESLKKYIIVSELFEEQFIVAIIISETKDEVLIKCDNTYPIILAKSKISSYIDVSDLSQSKIDCILGRKKNNKYKDNDYNDKEESKDYEGYYLVKDKKDN